MNTQFVIDSHMTEYPSSVTRNTSVAQALDIMKEGGFRHLPVLEDGKIVGIISQRDLIRMEPFLESLNPLVEDVMVKNPYIVSVGTPVSEVAHVMADEKFGCTIVVNNRMGVVGIFTTTDAMRLLSFLLEEVHVPRLNQAKIEEFFAWDA